MRMDLEHSIFQFGGKHPVWSDADVMRISGFALAHQLRERTITPEHAEMKARALGSVAIRILTAQEHRAASVVLVLAWTPFGRPAGR